MQAPLFEPTVDWVTPKVDNLPSWAAAKRVCVDVETCDPGIKELGPGVRRGSFVCGIAFAIEDGPSYYIPVAHKGGDNVANPDQAWAYLRDQAKAFTGDVVGMNLSYDLDFLEEQGVVFPSCRFFRDIMLAEPLIDELQMSYRLDAIAAKYGIPGKSEDEMREAAIAWGLIKRRSPKRALKEVIWKLPGRHVAIYGMQDVTAPLQISRKQERIIDEEDLWQVYDLESRVLPVVVAMRRRGVAVDVEQLDKVAVWARQEGEKHLVEVHKETGILLNLEDMNNATEVAKPLIESGVVLTERTAKGELKLDVEVLDKIDTDLSRHIARAKKMRNLDVKFVSSVRRHLVNGRIHCTLNQLKGEDETGGQRGAAFGRLSSSNPNLQQQPSRDDFASFWRSIYVPDKGCSWASLDYSQQEPRVLVHYAVLCNLPKAYEFAQMYRDDPNMDFHSLVASMCHGIPVSEVRDVERKPAKTIGLGKCYGMGGAKLCHDLGLPTEWKHIKKLGRTIEVAGSEGQSILRQFHMAVPFVEMLSKFCTSVADKKGFIKTLLGRHCRFPLSRDIQVELEGEAETEDENTSKYDWTWKALNRLIQGSAADQTKQAMVTAHEQGFPLQLQVHDELALSITCRDEAEALSDIMLNCIPMKVPSKVDIEIGPSWGDAK